MSAISNYYKIQDVLKYIGDEYPYLHTHVLRIPNIGPTDKDQIQYSVAGGKRSLLIPSSQLESSPVEGIAFDILMKVCDIELPHMSRYISDMKKNSGDNSKHLTIAKNIINGTALASADVVLPDDQWSIDQACDRATQTERYNKELDYRDDVDYFIQTIKSEAARYDNSYYSNTMAGKRLYNDLSRIIDIIIEDEEKGNKQGKDPGGDPYPSDSIQSMMSETRDDEGQTDHSMEHGAGPQQPLDYETSRVRSAEVPNLDYDRLIALLDPDLVAGHAERTRSDWRFPHKTIAHAYPKVVLPSRKLLDDDGWGGKNKSFAVCIDNSGSINNQMKARFCGILHYLAESKHDIVFIVAASTHKILTKGDVQRMIANGGVELPQVGAGGCHEIDAMDRGIVDAVNKGMLKQYPKKVLAITDRCNYFGHGGSRYGRTEESRKSVADRWLVITDDGRDAHGYGSMCPIPRENDLMFKEFSLDGDKPRGLFG